MGKYHNVLYIGVKVAWDWGVVDSQTVKQLLGNVYLDIVLLRISHKINAFLLTILVRRCTDVMIKQLATY